MSAVAVPPVRSACSARIRVPFSDTRAQLDPIRHEVVDALVEVLDGGSYILGPKVTAFESAFAAAHQVKHCIGVNSGTSALHLALISAGVGPGDEVITVPMTFIATSWAISYCGGTPVFVDVDAATCTMDPEQVGRKITWRTKAILPVHLYGQPADLEPLRAIAEKHGVALIEDAAQAHLATYHGHSVGTIGRAAAFSFYPGKNLGACGEGGAVVTNDDAMAGRMRALRDHAQIQRYHHAEIGFNYRMDAMQGAVLGIKMKHIARWTARRRELADRYFTLLCDLPLELPSVRANCEPVWHLFVVQHPERDRIRAELEVRGIQTGLHYPIPVHLQPAYRGLGYEPGDFPVTERVARECFTLPLFPEITEQQQDVVVRALEEIC
jgi:dTDP-4-amino-4,6-dideoxygalactose transaminase